MGIDKFHTWLKNTYYNSITEYNTSSYDHVYVDLNFLLHRLIAYSTSEKDLLSRVMESIDTIIHNNNPLKTLNLMADGSASYAKILLQKKRRLQTAQSLATKLKMENNIAVFDKKITPLHLTPGTQFMNHFNETIKKYVSDKIGKHIKVNLNLSDEPDESEFKISRYIVKNTTSVCETHLILSSDADIVLISLSLINIYNIDVVIQQGRENQTYIISIDQLLEQHMSMYGYHPLKRLDFVFLSILLGNDYFPKLRCAEFKKLWKVYKLSIKPYETIVNYDHSINLTTFINFLAKYLLNIPTKFKYVDADELVNTNVDAYLYGLSWCIHLYATGKYLDYGYSYHGQSVHPICIIQYIISRKIHHKQMIFTIPHEINNTPPISHNIYPIIVLPYCALRLIPEKYHYVIKNKLMYMYDEEFCKDCGSFKESLRQSRLIDGIIETEPDKKIYSMQKYITHKKTHVVLNPKDYINAIVGVVSNI